MDRRSSAGASMYRRWQGSSRPGITCVQAWFGTALQYVLEDVGYVMRILRRNPGFTATA